MTILQILILLVVAVLVGALPRFRGLALLAVSSFVVFWLQGAEPFTALEFWLPVSTVGATVLSWAVTTAPEMRGWRQNWAALAVLFGTILLFDLNRYFGLSSVFSISTPSPVVTLPILILLLAAVALLVRWQSLQRVWRAAAFLLILLIFVILKTPALSERLVHILAALRGKTAAAAAEPAALTWLGFSYLAFRLLHTIRDRQSGRLPAVTLAEYANYVIFFPAFTSGPIDRLERFVQDLRSPLPLDDAGWLEAGTRLVVGLFKKFVLADLLAVISINDTLVTQTRNGLWLWLFLYAFSLRIYFDFSGYTDVAIGLGRLLGVRLPENFTSPYLKPNLTQFWNSWHMTLTQWFRAYFFNPLTRALRGSRWPLPVWVVLLITQLSTMFLIGLWHGVTASFAAWGLWHGLGLFLQNRWSDWTRSRLPSWTQSPRGQSVMRLAGIFLTFQYVSLGWLFFTLSSPALAWRALLRLLGFG